MEKREVLIWFDNVSLGYEKDKPILKDLNIVEQDIVGGGQSICFLGRSGRGKSTLFKSLAGLLKPLSGKIVIDIDGTPTIVREGNVGFVDQKYTLFRHKTVMGILLFAMRKRKTSLKEKTAEANAILLDWGLDGHEEKYPNELSGGQRQRLAVIEKLLASNHYIIMDEPISGLDVVGVNNIKKNFRRVLAAHEKNTIIFSTHDLHFAMEMADVIYIVGRVKPEDTHSTIIERIELYDLVRDTILYDRLFNLVADS